MIKIIKIVSNVVLVLLLAYGGWISYQNSDSFARLYNYKWNNTDNSSIINSKEDVGVKSNPIVPYRPPDSLTFNVDSIKKNLQDIYSFRLNSIKRFCRTDKSVYKITSGLQEYYKENTWYVMSKGFTYCGIPKVGSSTWERHLSKLLNMESYSEEMIKLKVPITDYRLTLRNHFASFPPNRTMAQVMNENVNFVFTRHPFQRLMSGYYQKFAQKEAIKVFPQMKELNDLIIKRYRKKPKGSPRATPVEFVNYLVDEYKAGKIEEVNCHFRPQFYQCPFCFVDFDAVGTMETFEKDVATLVQNLKMEGLNSQDRFNKLGHSMSLTKRKKEFFSKLSQKRILELYQIFKKDFQMFGYHFPWNYIKLGF